MLSNYSYFKLYFYIIFLVTVVNFCVFFFEIFFDVFIYWRFLNFVRHQLFIYNWCIVFFIGLRFNVEKINNTRLTRIIDTVIISLVFMSFFIYVNFIICSCVGYKYLIFFLLMVNLVLCCYFIYFHYKITTYFFKEYEKRLPMSNKKVDHIFKNSRFRDKSTYENDKDELIKHKKIYNDIFSIKKSKVYLGKKALLGLFNESLHLTSNPHFKNETLNFDFLDKKATFKTRQRSRKVNRTLKYRFGNRLKCYRYLCRYKRYVRVKPKPGLYKRYKKKFSYKSRKYVKRPSLFFRLSLYNESSRRLSRLHRQWFRLHNFIITTKNFTNVCFLKKTTLLKNTYVSQDLYPLIKVRPSYIFKK